MFYVLYALYLIIFWILPLWILMMGVIILFRVNDPYYKKVRDNIIDILEKTEDLDEKSLQEAKDFLNKSHPINGIRHSIARMIVSKLDKKRWNRTQKKLIFHHLYKEPIPANIINQTK